MLSNIRELKQRISKAEEKRMESIYAECDKRGLARRFADSFYWRVVETPLLHTKSVIDSNARASKYNNKESVSQLKTFLKIMLETHPEHHKALEWKQCIKLIEKEGVQ